MAGGGGDRRGLAVVLGGVVALRKAATRGDAERIAGSMLALPAPWRATSIRFAPGSSVSAPLCLVKILLEFFDLRGVVYVFFLP